MEEEQDEVLQKALDSLTEHFESVTISVTHLSEGITHSQVVGSGNYFARIGAINEWLLREEERNRCKIRDEYDI